MCVVQKRINFAYRGGNRHAREERQQEVLEKEGCRACCVGRQSKQMDI